VGWGREELKEGKETERVLRNEASLCCIRGKGKENNLKLRYIHATSKTKYVGEGK